MATSYITLSRLRPPPRGFGTYQQTHLSPYPILSSPLLFSLSLSPGVTSSTLLPTTPSPSPHRRRVCSNQNNILSSSSSAIQFDACGVLDLWLDAVRVWIGAQLQQQQQQEVTKVAGSIMAMRPEGFDEGLRRMLVTSNLDQAADRRRLREAFKDVQLGIDHCLFQARYTGLQFEESYQVNSRGLNIFTKCWLPENSNLKALIFFCHGYGDTCSFFFEGIAKKLASSGFGVFAMDYPGFGLSDGLHGYVPSFDDLVNDVIEQFSKIRENPKYKGLPSFLFGQSMGGAVALKIHFKQPENWDGAVLVAPMCKIADNVVPPWPLQQILIAVAKVLPREKLVPQKDLAEMAFKDLRKRSQCSFNVVAYKDKPRLGTALELLRTTQELERRLGEVSLPLFILHGEADIVTDPSISKALYESASSSDKSIRLYKDAYHSILEGESDEMIFEALGDIISWLDARSDSKG